MSKKADILEGLTKAVVDGNVQAAAKFAKDALNTGVDPYEAIMKGCSTGMDIMSDKYDRQEVYVPEILCSAEAMNEAIGILKPHIKVEEAEAPGKVLLGVVEGDIHDIGKNIVKILLDAAGFEVVDLGRNVQLKMIVEKIKEEKPDVLGMSALMSTSMIGMPETIQMIKDAGLRDTVKIMVGGAPISAAYAEEMGADGFGDNGPEAVKLAGALVKAKRG